ncbi:MAG: hypothetical protein WD534_11730 [Phycisphaeraceae bacterium]
MESEIDRTDALRCPACNYDLRGNVHNTCPECGEHLAIMRRGSKDESPAAIRNFMAYTTIAVAMLGCAFTVYCVVLAGWMEEAFMGGLAILSGSVSAALAVCALGLGTGGQRQAQLDILVFAISIVGVAAGAVELQVFR